MTWHIQSVKPRTKALQDFLDADWEPFSVTVASTEVSDVYYVWLRKLDD